MTTNYSSRLDLWKAHLGDPAIDDDEPTWEELDERYPFPALDEGSASSNTNNGHHSDNNAPNNSNNNDDPLTAMYLQDVQQQDRLQARELQYRRERAAAHRRGVVTQRIVQEDLVTPAEQRVISLQIIDKDLARLVHPSGGAKHSQHHTTLRRVLFVFSCHVTEYQQGMHEVASYILYALELESTTASASLCYAWLRRILLPLLPAYDVDLTTTTTTANPSGGSSKPLQETSQRICQGLLQPHDPALLQALYDWQVPPALVFSKWLRLWWSREVPNVLQCWDFLISNTTAVDNQQNHRYNNNNNNSSHHHKTTTLLDVGEAACAARLLWHRHTILQGGLPQLMNLPIEEEGLHAFRTLVPALLSPTGASLNLLALVPAPSYPHHHHHHPTLLHPMPHQTPKHQTPLHNPTAAAAVGEVFSLVKDTLMSKTQSVGEQLKSTTLSVSQRLQREWDQHQYQYSNSRNLFGGGTERNYDDPTTEAGPYHYYSPQQVPPTTSTSRQMEASLEILHQYLVQQHQNAVPPAVWQAMAQLRVIRQDLMEQNL